MKNLFKNWSKFEIMWLVIFISILGGVQVYSHSSTIGTITGLLGLLYCICVAKGSPYCYLYGIVQMVLYSYVAFTSKIYGDVMLNTLYCIPMQFIGIYTWLSNKKQETTYVKPIRLDSKTLKLLVVIIPIVIGVYSRILSLLGGNTPLFDATTTVCCIFAMYLSVNRYVNQWYLWIVCNVMSIIMWTMAFLRGEANTLPMIIMWIAYFFNSLYGLYNWNKMYEKEKSNE